MKISQLLLFTFILALASTGWTLTEEHYHDQEMLLMQQHVDDMKTHMTMMQQMKVLTTEDQWIEMKRQMELMMQHMDMMLTTMDNMYHQPPEQKSRKHDHRKFKQHN
ncbi:MAG: hypothetical protein QGD92_08680 [Gammaproteobacteria bacterium]|nr:hypothetical protein [Gammaproteobacteria bacterium]